MFGNEIEKIVDISDYYGSGSAYNNIFHKNLRLNNIENFVCYNNRFNPSEKMRVSGCENILIRRNQDVTVDINGSEGVTCDSNTTVTDTWPLMISGSQNITIAYNNITTDTHCSIHGSSVILHHNLIHSLNNSGAIYCSGGEINYFSNSTQAGGVDFIGCISAVVRNNIISAYPGSFGISMSGCANYEIDYNLLWTDYNYYFCEPGPHDIVAAPLMAGGNPFDFHLLPGSPCIDTGDPSLPNDPDGSPPDRGALYFDHSAVVKEPHGMFPAKPRSFPPIPIPSILRR